MTSVKSRKGERGTSLKGERGGKLWFLVGHKGEETLHFAFIMVRSRTLSMHSHAGAVDEYSTLQNRQFDGIKKS